MLIGRKEEQDVLRNALNDEKSHFIAVYGRRRIGKTFLIRETFGYRFMFQHSGLSHGSMKEQLFAFTSSLRDAGISFKKTPKNWLEAFEILKSGIRTSTEQRKLIFIDELSWMDTPKSDLMTALENFWNGFASARNDVVLIICASATSWILSKVIHNKGGLYNRLTEQIHLKPFSLFECEQYVAAANLIMSREQILQYYMAVGGVPFYWSFLKKGKSLSQNIDAIFFAENAPLKDEYNYLYASIFKNPKPYEEIITALGTKKLGMTRDEIINNTALANCGSLSTKLEELESCGFIRKYYAYGMKKKNAVYQLIDFFTLFYFQFLKSSPTDSDFWTNQVNTPRINTWLGLAFERVCLLHVLQIKKKLGISGILTTVNAWSCESDRDNGIYGSQIDMLIVRKDQVINLCEMKYSGTEYVISENVNRSIQNKIHDLTAVTKTKYAIYPTLITTYGLIKNTYSENIQSVITMKDLFAE